MTREEIYEKLTAIYRQVFDDETLVLTDETTADDIEDWDSLEQINIMVLTESTFNIKLGIKEMSHMANIGELVNKIGELTGKG